MNETLTRIGRYEILERVGRGGMGVLYRGRDTVLDREVAIKLMSGDFSSDETARTRFFREARAAARLQHRNVVTIFEFAEHDDTPYIVMEFLRGRSLASRLREPAPFSLLEKLDVIIQLCAGLEFAHRDGVVHRDVKPANIWLCEDGSVKLLDFGIAKSASSTITRFGSVMGSPSYMSPEQIAGRDLDGRSDVFSAGVVLYELASGRKPFEAESPTAVMMKITQEAPRPLAEVAPDLPAALVATVNRALAKNVDERYASAADLAADLQLVRLEIEDGRDPEPSVILDETLFADDVFRVTPAPVAGTVIAPRIDPQPKGLSKALVAAATFVILMVIGSVAWWSGGGSAEIGAEDPAPPITSGPSTPTPAAAPTPAPPPAVPAAAPTALAITSTPEGASVLVDGRDRGLVTPISLPLTGKDRPRRLRLTKKGFEPKDVTVTGEMLAAGSLAIQLEEADTRPVTVVADGEYPFEIVDGGRVISASATSHRVNVAGRRTIRLQSSEFFLNQSFTVDPASGRQSNIRVPAPGRLTIRTALETCTIVIDGRPVGFPDQVIAIPIAAGSHAVQLKCQSGASRPVTVTITPGQLTQERIQ